MIRVCDRDCTLVDPLLSTESDLQQAMDRSTECSILPFMYSKLLLLSRALHRIFRCSWAAMAVMRVFSFILGLLGLYLVKRSSAAQQ